MAGDLNRLVVRRSRTTHVQLSGCGHRRREMKATIAPFRRLGPPRPRPRYGPWGESRPTPRLPYDEESREHRDAASAMAMSPRTFRVPPLRSDRNHRTAHGCRPLRGLATYEDSYS